MFLHAQVAVSRTFAESKHSHYNLDLQIVWEISEFVRISLIISGPPPFFALAVWRWLRTGRTFYIRKLLIHKWSFLHDGTNFQIIHTKNDSIIYAVT